MDRKAGESAQVQRARKKVAEKLAQEEKAISDSAIGQTKKAIHHWIERHEEDRVALKDKSITIEPAKNTYVTKLLQSLKTEAQTSKAYEKLIGRIRKEK